MIIKILLLIDGVIYNLIDRVYSIFEFLARLNLFGEEQYNAIVNRLYIILGTVMLFVLAYALLRAIINPDDFAKGEHSFPNLIKNLIISLIIIVLLPTIFTVAFNVQNAILNTGTITKVILGENNLGVQDGGIDMEPGRMMAYYTFTSFFYPTIEYCEYELNKNVNDPIQLNECKQAIKSNGFWFIKGSHNLAEIEKGIMSGRSFTNYSRFSKQVDDDNIEYQYLVSTVCGVFMLYILLNFCFDMALRVVKLMFYQMIAPIPVICRVIPFGGLKDVFNKWTKQVIGTFVEVFIRIAIMNLGVLLIKLTVQGFATNDYMSNNNLSWVQLNVARVLVIMGVVIFIRKAPKLISDMFGIDTGGMKLGLMDKLAMGGGLVAGAAIGAGAGMLARNGVNAFKNTRQAYKNGGVGAAIGAGVRGLGSTIAGTASGFARGGYGARSAHNAQDMRNARTSAVNNAVSNRENRASYRAQHASQHHGIVGAVDTVARVGWGHTVDHALNFADRVGITPALESYTQEKNFYSQITAIDDNTDSVAVDLIGRDQFRGSAALMSAAGGPNMSLAAMKEQLDILRSSGYNGGTMTISGFYPNSDYEVSNAQQFAERMAELQQTYNDAERGLKKYVKTQGYRGQAGVATIEGLLGTHLGGGEAQRMAKLASDRQTIQDLVAENQPMIDSLNGSVQSAGDRITSINDGTVGTHTGAWDQMDQLVNNVKNRVIQINSEMQRMQRERDRRNGSNNNNGSNGGH